MFNLFLLGFLVQLWGDPQALEVFKRTFGNGDPCVLAESPFPLLSGTTLNGARDSSHAMEIAQDILDQMYGVLTVIQGSALRPKLNGYIFEKDDGTRSGGILLASESRVALEPVASPKQAQPIPASSASHDRLALALSVWAMEPRIWPRLYRIVEELNEFTRGQLISGGFCSKNQLKRFRQSSGSAEVASKDSRHAFGNPAPPKPMTMGEAEEFVGKLLRDVLTKS